MNSNTWYAWFDGATKDTNPGVRGIGGVLKGPAGERIEVSDEIGPGTNNEAEYAALMAVLDAAVEAKVQNLIVQGDSQLVVRQVNGEWFIKEKNRRMVKETPGYLKPSSHSTGECLHQVILPVMKFHQPEQFIYSLSPYIRRNAIEPAMEIHILPGGEFLIKALVLKYYSDGFSDTIFIL